MAQLWYRNQECKQTGEQDNQEERWTAEGLVAERSIERWTGQPAVIVRVGNGCGPKPAFALIAHPESVRVNGQVLFTGIRILRDRDEILCTNGSRLWFSAENVAEVSLFDDGRDRAGDAAGEDSTPVLCPRCRGAIRHGDEVVACPSCGLFYHWLETRRCYDVHRECVGCEGPTVDVGDPAFAWTPCDL